MASLSSPLSPSPPTSAYARLVARNAPVVAAAEGALRTLTYLLPGRFPRAELAAEAVYALVSLLSVQHDAILQPIAVAAAGPLAASAAAAADSSHAFNAYVRHLHRSRGSAFRAVAHGVAALQVLQVLLEMLAVEFGGAARKTSPTGEAAPAFSSTAETAVVAAVEVAKTAGRMYLFLASGRRMLLHSAIPERDYDPATLASASEDAAAAAALSHRLPRTGKMVPTIAAVQAAAGATPNAAGSSGTATADAASRVLLARALRSSGELAAPEARMPVLRGARLVGEWLHILRPLVYLLLLHRYGRRSWRPWVAGGALELASLALLVLGRRRRLATDGTRSAPPAPLKQLETAELQRRAVYVLYAVLRSPFYEAITKPRLEKFVEAASTRPIVSFFA
ncbi:Peroxisomal membrane protein pex16, partial [Cladochytrium tenue]